jgi:hypothetical protein
MAAWPGWARDVLALLGAPDSAENERFLNGWQAYEGSNCANNPLNTTLSFGGSSQCNSVGVQSYPSTSAGAQATAKTLENGYYPDIVAALRSGNPFKYKNPQAVAAQVTKWGTPNWANIYLSLVGIGTPGGTAPLPPVLPDYTPVPVAPKAHDAWGDLRNAVNRKLPTSLARSQAIRRAARRRLARKGRTL